MMQKIVITGATGHVGKAFLRSSYCSGFEIHAIVRKPGHLDSGGPGRPPVHEHVVEDLTNSCVTDLAVLFSGAETVIHLAALIDETGPIGNSATEKMALNVALAAAKAKVPRILVVSSIYATLAQNGDCRARAYGKRKLAAEYCFSSSIASANSLIFIRPPAVYGHGMEGSLDKLTGFVARNVPLPLGLAIAPRDYISVNNLSHLLGHLMRAEREVWELAAGRIYEPCDGKAICTRDMVMAIAAALGKRVRLLPVPTALLRIFALVSGQNELIEGAIDPIQATGNDALAEDFGWRPIERMPESLCFL